MIGARSAALATALAFGSLLTAGPGWAERDDGDQLIVLDGDTVVLPCAVPTRSCAEKVRLTEIDAPEVFHPDCEAERIAGLRAKERVAGLIRGQPVELVRSGETDRDGRTLGSLQVPTGAVGAILLHEGLALSDRPGREAKAAPTAQGCRPDRR
ncbi:thermonuclease family protein [Methylobacterium sp. CCH5-D2]|uniref:thermonuclease family protein n=1 Tax=Methylobacterium sp. CCH5-D2 TaxID=1768765 RepID=UPI00082BE8BB|nr:thermonuclease family protein [Methylobacterium sp. CCH5-D2]